MKILTILKKTIISGLIVWLPIVATITIVRFIIDGLDQIFKLLPVQYQPNSILGVHVPGLGLITSIIILILTGILINNIIGKKVLTLSERLLNKIPIIRSIYNSLKKVSTTLLQNKNAAFLKVLLIEYPRKGLYSIAFQTSTIPLTECSQQELITVFIPTTPNPTSGFVLLLPSHQATLLNISVEDALRLVISLGSVIPADLHHHLSELKIFKEDL
jgi:uncharacterized membrane protein